jgi:short-subunit dehydrogenase
MNILITGAGKGIGYQLTLEFAKHENMNLYLISRSIRDLKKLEKECYKINPSVKITIIPFDIEDFINDDFPELLDFQQLDILINNAGLLIKKDFAEFEVDDFLKLTRVNFLAPAMLIKHLIGVMGGAKPTHVINIGSIGGYQGSVKFKGLSMYSATKAALASLTECLAAEYAKNNIYFNCLALGAVQTGMLQQAFPGYRAPLNASEMAEFICHFALKGYRYFNGKVLPVSVSIP